METVSEPARVCSAQAWKCTLILSPLGERERESKWSLGEK